METGPPASPETTAPTGCVHTAARGAAWNAGAGSEGAPGAAEKTSAATKGAMRVPLPAPVPDYTARSVRTVTSAGTPMRNGSQCPVPPET